jgi:1,4-alpha-glucan branching enzyme
MKWDMGWMHDTLQYFERDPIHRRYHLNELTFRAVYALNENFMLPLSHDEVVHGKGSLLGKMPGDDWQKFANLRLLYTYMWTLPGKKLLFMGAELGQWQEWNHDHSLDWPLADVERHQQIQRLLQRLNWLYREQPALHERDFEAEGFEWIRLDDHDNSVLAYLRRSGSDTLLVVLNFTPVLREGYRLGVPETGQWLEIFSSDSEEFGGSGVHSGAPLSTTIHNSDRRPHSVELTVPPLGAVILRRAL